MAINIFKFIEKKLQHNQKVMLLFVVESIGSSPGRAGFAMAVAEDENFEGTIGGGIMEFKLVEKAKTLLKEGAKDILLQEQFHDKEHTKNQSGMICSGSQKIVFVPLFKTDLVTIQSCSKQSKKSFTITPGTIVANDFEANNFNYQDKNNWQYSQNIVQQNTIHIIGAGHCGLALSELMRFLDFYVHIYDDREYLNTLGQNTHAHQKHIVDYDNILAGFSAGNNDYVVIMTIGYRTDKLILKQLIHQQYFYLGLLGSKKKIETLFSEMLAEGIDEIKLQSVHSPIGIDIASKTTREIAVSIAAEIIKAKNTL